MANHRGCADAKFCAAQNLASKPSTGTADLGRYPCSSETRCTCSLRTASGKVAVSAVPRCRVATAGIQGAMIVVVDIGPIKKAGRQFASTRRETVPRSNQLSYGRRSKKHGRRDSNPQPRDFAWICFLRLFYTTSEAVCKAKCPSADGL